MDTTALIIVAIAVTGFWYAIIVLVALATRQREPAPGAPTMQLGAEPPAIVNLLVTRAHPTSAAADATLLDLAARRILELHQPSLNPADLLIRVREPAPTGLTSYEQRLFDRFASWAGDRFVPLSQAAARYADGGPTWFAAMRTEVVADAQARGLVVQRRPGSWVVFLCMVVGGILACLGALPFVPSDPHPSGGRAAIGNTALVGGLCAVPFITVVLLIIAVAHLRRLRITDAGLAAAGHWLGVAAWLAAHDNLADLPPAAVTVWDRYLSYGVALGVNPAAESALDLATGRTAAFTSFNGGTVRTIVAHYPRNPFAYTQAGARAVWSLLVSVLWIAFWSFVPGLSGWPDTVRVPVLAACGLLTIRTAYRLVMSVLAALAPITVTGPVLAAHAWRPNASATMRWIQLVVDDGRHSRTRPWLIRDDRGRDINPGDVVSMRAQRWTHYVLRADVIRKHHASGGAASAGSASAGSASDGSTASDAGMTISGSGTPTTS